MSTAERAVLLAPDGEGFVAVELDATESRALLSASELAAWVRQRESDAVPRWVLPHTPDIAGLLLDAGVVLTRAWDLGLCHEILSGVVGVAGSSAESGSAPAVAGALPPWTGRRPVPDPALPALVQATLFELPDDAPDAAGPDIEECVAQYRAQRAAAASDPRLLLLCQAESAGALVAAEMHAAGVPWDRIRHEEILAEVLGERAPGTGTPGRMAALAGEVRQHLGDAHLNLDSPVRVLRALRDAGVDVSSTSRWELAEHEHPAIAPLLAYKKLARLYTANGWAWLDAWVRESRFRPVYVPGGVVTGRWASAGGGALQIPRLLRDAVRADPGWRLVVADVAQLEPRMLAAMSGDLAMAEAARGADLYAGVVVSGAVADREEAKYAVLGAMYGATSGTSGQLVPRLRRVYPRAMALVDDAAQTGASGGAVRTWLGRTSPPPSTRWRDLQRAATLPGAGAEEEQRARRAGADRGRFTRNFIVQGTAAEWSLIWLAEIRHRLAQLPQAERAAAASGPVFADRAHLAFFLHDEVIVHVTEEQSDAAAAAVVEAARVATVRLFGDFPIEVPLDVRVAASAHK